MSGSFQPLTTEDWTEQAYISTIEQLMQCVLENNVAAIKAILDVPDVNLKAKLLLQRDYVGRSPLQLALLERKTEAALALIELGARITARLVDGRTNFMLAAQCGNVEVVKAMLARSAKNKEDAAKARAAAPASGDEEAEGVLVDGEDEDEEDEDGAVLVKHPAVDTEEPSDGLPVDSHLRPDVINLAYVPWDVSTCLSKPCQCSAESLVFRSKSRLYTMQCSAVPSTSSNWFLRQVAMFESSLLACIQSCWFQSAFPRTKRVSRQ